MLTEEAEVIVLLALTGSSALFHNTRNERCVMLVFFMAVPDEFHHSTCMDYIQIFAMLLLDI